MPQKSSDTSGKLLGALGLCARARALIYGTSMICEALRSSHPPRLVLEASDTSEGTHKRLTDKCNFYHIRHVRLPVTGIELAHAVGKSAALAAVAISDGDFVRLVEDKLRAMNAQDQ